MKISLTKADQLFSLLVRERAGNRCERCGRSEGKLDCSHHWSRRLKQLRWDPLNACALCYICHAWWHSFPGESGVWLRNKIGEDQYAYLVAKAQEPFKLDTAMKAHILKRLKESQAVFENREWRNNTINIFGRFDFDNPYLGTVEPLARKPRKKAKKKKIKFKPTKVKQLRG